MSLILRIDVDRPYGSSPLWRHTLSRLASDLWFPPVRRFGYLKELKDLLEFLRERKARGHIFFRRCTLPGPDLLEQIQADRHVVGLHLENSRSLDSFLEE